MKIIKYTIIALCLLVSASAFSQKKDSALANSKPAVIGTVEPNQKGTVQYNGYVSIGATDTSYFDHDRKQIPSQKVQYFILNKKTTWVKKSH